jgi:sugar phosphate isomerase/epimerase
MKIFASSRLFGSLPLAAGISLASTLGYDGVELWYDQCYDVAISTLRDCGFIGSIHAATRDINLTSVNPAIANVSLREVFRSIDLAVAVGAPLVVVHPGRTSSRRDASSDFRKALLGTLCQITQYAAERAITVAVENMEVRPRELITTAEETEALLKLLPEPSLGLCLDVPHAASATGVDSFLVSPLVERIIHAHISNSTSERMHVPLWQGEEQMTTNLRSFLCQADIAIVIEGEDSSVDSHQLLTQNLENLQRLLRIPSQH